MTWQDDITVGIKSFERPEAVRQCARSVRERYPGAEILVGDDSAEPPEVPDADEVMHLPFDVGLTTARNLMVDRAARPLFLLMDDDMTMYGRTDLERMYRVLTETPFNLVGGQMGTGPWHGCFAVEGDRLVLYVGAWRDVIDGHRRYDCVQNFFLAPTDLLRRHRWTDGVKIGGEHAGFFWRGSVYRDNTLRVTRVRSFVAHSHRWNTERFRRMTGRRGVSRLAQFRRFGFREVATRRGHKRPIREIA